MVHSKSRKCASAKCATTSRSRRDNREPGRADGAGCTPYLFVVFGTIELLPVSQSSDRNRPERYLPAPPLDRCSNRSGTGGASSMDSRTAGRYSINRTRILDYLLCRGDDEISTLAREFSLMITGLGKRGSAAEAKGLAESSVYPINPFTAEYVRPPPPTAPSAPAMTAVSGAKH